MRRFRGCIAGIAGIHGHIRHLCGVMVVAVRYIAVIVMVMCIVHQGHLHRLLMNRPARHAHGASGRMERQHGDQEPKQKCLVKMFHVKDQYSTHLDVTKAGGLMASLVKIRLPMGGRSSVG